jgi:hypothetical protein
MRQFLARSVSHRVAFATVALALLLSVAIGRMATPAFSNLEPNVPQTSAIHAANPSAEDSEHAATGLLASPRRQEPEAEVRNLFVSHSWRPAPAPPRPLAKVVAPEPPPPHPAPTAPPLPFQYRGRMIDGNKLVVFLQKQQETVSISAGDVLDNTYKIESITDRAVHFRYLPLDTKQVLDVLPR